MRLAFVGYFFYLKIDDAMSDKNCRSVSDVIRPVASAAATSDLNFLGNGGLGNGTSWSLAFPIAIGRDLRTYLAEVVGQSDSNFNFFWWRNIQAMKGKQWYIICVKYVSIITFLVPLYAAVQCWSHPHKAILLHAARQYHPNHARIWARYHL